MTYTQIKYGEYEEAEQSVTLRANSGDCGGVLRYWLYSKYMTLPDGTDTNRLTTSQKPSKRRMEQGGGNVPIVVEQYVLERDTTLKVSRGGVCFTLGGLGQVSVVVETLVFDRAQVTSKMNGNRPVWGGCCHTISAGNAGEAVLIIQGRVYEKDEEGTNRVSGRYNDQD